MDKLFINYSGNIESFKRLGLEETYKKCIVFIEKDGAIYTHNTYYAGPDIIKSIQEALSELQEEVKEGDYVASIRQVDGKIETTMGTFEGRDSKILEDSMSYTDELKRDVTKAIATEYIRATGVEKSLSERIDSHLDITERELSEKADKDSVYDKDQIDLKLTGVYKIKGSCTFEELPETNKVGDVYNITNSFTLDEEEYTAGTNVVYTENGWDVLAGIFDTSAIELDIQRISNLLALEAVRAIKAENDLEDKINEGAARALEKELELDKKFDNYLPLSGGAVNYLQIGDDLNEEYNYLVLKRLGKAVRLNNTDNDYYLTLLDLQKGNKLLNSISVGLEGIRYTEDGLNGPWYKIWHEGNFNPNNYLLRTGGTISKEVDLPIIVLKNTKTMPYVLFTQDSVNSFLGTSEGELKYLRPNDSEWSTVWHSGNDGSGSGLDADKLDGLLANQFLRTINPIDDINDINLYKLYSFVTDLKSSCLNVPLGFSSGEMIYIAGYDTGFMLVSSYMKDLLIYRRGTNALSTSTIISNDWKTIAFTDYNGFYDLYGGKEIPNKSDLNDYKTIGTYHCNSNANASTLVNSPTTSSFVMSISNATGTTDALKQELKEWFSGKKYMRVYEVALKTWSEWRLISTNLSTYNAPTATKATQDSEGNVITDTYALKSDVIVGENITDGVYAVKADGSLCTVDKADTSCIGAALIVDDHKFMIAKSDATNDGSNYNLNWEYTLTNTSLPNHSYVYNTSYEEGYLPNANGEYTSTPNLPSDYTLWNYGSLSEFDGKSNTAIVSDISNNAKDIFTVLKTFNQEEQASGRSADWYVPALGQLALIYLNITDINEVLTKIGGTTLRNNIYWSSTEHSANFAWIVNFSNGYVYEYRKVHYGYAYARFIRDIQIESPKSVKESITKIKNQLKQPASALKLSTPIKLWGNDFDGSSNINGIISFSTFSSTPTIKFANGEYIDGYGNIMINDASLWHMDANSGSRLIAVKGTGNVGIGTADPLYKLDVNGLCRVKRSIIINNNEAFLTFDAAGHMLPVMQLNANDNLRIGSGTASYGHNTYVSGNNLILTYGTSNTTGMVLNSSGNVTISGSDLALTNYKLYVDGLLHTNSLSIQSDTKVDNLNADKLDGYEAEDFALKSDVEVEVEVPNGVYAVTADGKLIDYHTADSSCIGVAFISDNQKIMIAKEDATDGTNTTWYWGRNFLGQDVPNLANITDYLAAKADYNGKANTAAIIAGYTAHGVEMNSRDMCKVLETYNEGGYTDWYVPAAGQLYEFYTNKAAINEALAAISGTAFTSSGYWSSSEKSADDAWGVLFNNGSVFSANENGNDCVRFVRDITTITKPLKEKVSELESQIGDINTILESIING